jgi:cytosine/adenosine deaminase-related metal-dependent hydrolase
MPIEDFVVRGGIVLTCDDRNSILEGADVVVEQGRIAQVSPKADARRKRRPARVLDASGCAVLPGFVQAHVHLCQTLFRGMASDLPLLRWLRERIWPLEAAHDEISMQASAELGLAELLRSGTTTILDMGSAHHYEVVMDTLGRSGIRGFGGKAMMDTGEGAPKRLREATRKSLRTSEALARACRDANTRIGYAFAPRFVLSCSEELVRGASALAAEFGALMHTHVAEHPSEREEVRRRFGTSDVALMRRWGITGPRAILAHGVQLTRAEVRSLARAETRIVHCPSANLKLGSGVAQLSALREGGICVALGSDGAPCNDNHDAFIEMRHAALLAQWRSGPGSIRAVDVLRMATIDGARALGLAEQIGSIEVGKSADLVVVNLSDLHTAPALDPISAVVYAAQSRDVRDVLVGGDLLVEGGELRTLDADAIAARARTEARRIGRRAGVI